MKNVLIPLLLSLLLISCGRKTLPPAVQKNYTTLNLTALIADNLSEDITGNDEVHLMVCLIKDTVPLPILLKEWNDLLFFKKEGNDLQKKINFELTTTGLSMEKTRLLFLLMESDTKDSTEERAEKVKEVLIKNNYQYSDSLSKQIGIAIRDDDVLGLSFHKLSELCKNENGTIVFSGTSLFDKYYYRLKYSWK